VVSEVTDTRAEARQCLTDSDEARMDVLRSLLEQVTDPEIPVLSIHDLGILRDISLQGERVTVTVTGTYSGCPAMRTIENDIHEVLSNAGYRDVRVRHSLSPAWTTDWMTAQGRAKLKEYGIAPPRDIAQDEGEIACPQCGSSRTECISEFGSTACKALYRCLDCKEPFDYFKCL
jgi:ring-1,2-phenylacetyl-CoA epoxidase subunit PaaD